MIIKVQSFKLCVFIVLVLVFTLNPMRVFARYEKVLLGVVSLSETSDWSDSDTPFDYNYIEAMLLQRGMQTYPGYSNYQINIIQNRQSREEKNKPAQKRGNSAVDAFMAGWESVQTLKRYVLNASAQVYGDKWIDDHMTMIKDDVESEEINKNQESKKMDLKSAVEKSIIKVLDNVPSGSRIAIEKISSANDIDKSEIRDIIIDKILEENYNVVAKKYFEKVKEELEEQSSGQYSDRTRVKENNLSASGYLLECKISENKVRVYLISVSTGEYVSIAAIDYE